ncbi:restriction endonuclease S subunit [Hoeflea sp. IMCC20628]|uniref:restriction endonuclease subunit S n=1 Tax=Hoeflea sp. IMCC20628 TaxID=1620421 RepID=UPI00063AA009|nr:restriction endonuclease subunit S [Hoeflea sp. IMCC20628]AKI02262.1 restriction endonuclease S subunit [Hoeflea sp. IMCC20628]
MSELPRGWAELQLKEITKIGGGSVNPKDYPNEIFELYSVPSFSEGQPDTVSGAEIGSTKQIVQNDDVLLCKIVPHIRRVWTVGKQGEHRQIASGEWIVYRNHCCEPRFLKFALSENNFRQKFLGTVSGVGGSLMRASPKSVAEFHIPLPPLAEQKRIVAKLDALATKSARARTDLARIDTLVTRYKKAMLSKVFSGELTKNWPSLPLENACIRVFDGPFGSNLKSADYTDDGPRVVRLENIGVRTFIEDKRTYISAEKFAALAKHTLQANDLLFSSFVSEEVRACLFPENAKYNAINKADCFCVRLEPDKANPQFVLLQLTSEATYLFFAQQVHGATRPRINLTQLRAYEIILPSLGKQQEIVSRVESAFHKIDRLAAEAKRALELVGKLDEAILAKAFKGQLVPQDLNDEHASALLERIKAERAAAPKMKQKRIMKA